MLATPASGLRLYYAGAGGTVYYVENPDSDTPSTPVQQCFFTDLASYTSNATGFNRSVFINTALTADASGNIFFGFRVVTNAAPAPLNAMNGGFARIDPDGNTIYVPAAAAAGDPRADGIPHNCAPALSNDGGTVYVVARGFTNDYHDGSYYNYLLGLNSVTLATNYRVLLRGPGGSSVAVSDDSTASPVIGPDGDVYFGVLSGHDGYLLHIQRRPGRPKNTGRVWVGQHARHRPRRHDPRLFGRFQLPAL